MTALFLLSGCLIDWKLYNERLAELQARDSGCALVTAWVDADGDGYGDAERPEALCELVDGYAEQPGDCDDGDADVNPEAGESCATEADDDCDGQANEEGAGDGTPWYADADGDGFGDAGDSVLGCGEIAGRVSEATDCDDADAEVHPGAEEVCGTGVDEDCDNDTTECRWEGEVSTAEADVTFTGGVGWVSRVGDLTGDGGDDIAIADDDDVYLVSDPGDGVWETGEVAVGRVTQGDTAFRFMRVATGDFDGDGGADLAVSAVTDDEPREGAVYVFGGSGSATTTDASVRLGSVDDGTERLFGWDMKAADVDGDGLSELWVAAPSTAESGMAYLFEPASAGNTPVATLYGEPGDYLGYTVAAGDVSGDGVDDLVVGAPAGGDDGAGIVYVTFGPVTGLMDVASADVRLAGAAAGDLFGLSVSFDPFVDADGDGDTDLVIGAWGESSFVARAGAAYLFTGPLDGSLDAGDAIGVYRGAHADAGMGMVVCGANDLDGDGRGDIILGAHPAEGSDGTGRAYAMYGPATGTWMESDLDLTIAGAGSDSDVGFVAMTPDDWDADGLSDIVTADSKTAAGTAEIYVLRGLAP